jgi:hypothetical protein
MKERFLTYIKHIRETVERSSVRTVHDFGRSRDWLLGLGAVTALTCILLGVSVYMFITSGNVSSLASEEVAVSTKAEKDQLQHLLEIYRTRTTTFETLRTEPGVVPNPGGVMDTSLSESEESESEDAVDVRAATPTQ